MRYRFGPFVLDDREATLEASGQRIVLTHKTLLTLLHLVRNPGRLVTREELIEAVWPDAVVEEGNLHWTISAIRKALAPFESGPLIETVRGRGYRFLPAVVDDPGELFAPSPPDQPAAPPPAAPAPGVPSARPRRLLSILAVAAAASAIGVGAFLFGSRQPRRPWLEERDGPRAKVAVVGFHDVAGRAEGSWVGAALAEMVAADLTAAGRLQAVSREEVGRLVRDLGIPRPDLLSRETLRKIRALSGAELVVVGAYIVLPGAGRPLRVDAHVQETGSGATVATVSRTGSEEKLLDLVADLDASLRSRLGLGDRTGEEATAVRESVPASPEALRLYAEGLLELRSHRWKEAVSLLERAVVLAPRMAAAQRALSGAAQALGRQKEAEEAAFAALGLTAGLPRIDRLEIEAHYRTVNRDWERAIPAWRKVLKVAPEMLEARLALVRALESARRIPEAEAELAAIRASGGPAAEDPRVDLAEARLLDRTGGRTKGLQAAERALARARALSSPSLAFRASIVKIDALVDLGRFPEAREAIAEAQRFLAEGGNEPALRSDLLLREAGLLNAMGERDGARKRWLEALDIENTIGRVTSLPTLHFNLSIVARVQGDVDEEERRLREALVGCGVAGRQDCRELVYPSLGRIALLRGDLTEAERLEREALRLCREGRNVVRERDAASELANLMFERGRPDEALAFRRRAVELAAAQEDRFLVAGEQLCLADLLVGTGKAAEAEAVLREVREALSAMPGAPVYLTSDLLVVSSRHLLATSGPSAAPRALALVEKAAGIMREPREYVESLVLLRFGLARARAAGGDLAGARAALRELLGLAERTRQLPTSLRARLWLARLEAIDGSATAAAAKVDEVRSEARARSLAAIEREAGPPLSGRVPLL